MICSRLPSLEVTMKRSSVRTFFRLAISWTAIFGAIGCSEPSQQSRPKPAPAQIETPDKLRAAILEYQTRLQQINRSKIIKGKYADPQQFPWQVGLIKAGYTPKDGQFCGGTIIAKRWILTAAHCFPPGAQGEDQDVFAGSADLANGEIGLPSAEFTCMSATTL